MDFYTMLDQVLALLRQRGRVSYRALKRQFQLDDETLADLTAELLYAHHPVGEEGSGLVWLGDANIAPEAPSPVRQPETSRSVQATPGTRGMPPQATYVFKHALIQDAAYQSLLKSTRQQYHQRIAQVLGAQFSELVETQPELLAHHYTEAGLAEQAIPYWQRAGERAVQRSANVEATGHLTREILLRSRSSTLTARLRNCLQCSRCGERRQRAVPLS
jgi:hypothetical protein